MVGWGLTLGMRSTAQVAQKGGRGAVTQAKPPTFLPLDKFCYILAMYDEKKVGEEMDEYFREAGKPIAGTGINRETELFLQWSNDELLWLWGQVKHRSSRDAKRGLCFLMVITQELARRLKREESGEFLDYLKKRYRRMKEIREL